MATLPVNSIFEFLIERNMKRTFFTAIALVLASNSFAEPSQTTVEKVQTPNGGNLVPQNWTQGNLGGIPALWNSTSTNFLLEDIDIESFLRKSKIEPIANAKVWNIEIVVVSREERLKNGQRTRAQLDDSTYLLIDSELNLLEKRLETTYRGNVDVVFKKRVILTPYRHYDFPELKSTLKPSFSNWINASIRQTDWEDANGSTLKSPFASICFVPFTTSQTLRNGLSPVEAVSVFDTADGNRFTLRERIWEAWKNIVAQQTVGLVGRPVYAAAWYPNGSEFLDNAPSGDGKNARTSWIPAQNVGTLEDVLNNPYLTRNKRVAAPVAEQAVQLTLAGDVPGNRLWINQQLLRAKPEFAQTLSSRYTFFGGIPDKPYCAFDPLEGETVQSVIQKIGMVTNRGVEATVPSAHGRFRISDFLISGNSPVSINLIVGPGDPTGWIDIPLSENMDASATSILVEFEVKNSSPEYFGLRFETRDKTVVPIPALPRNQKPADAEWVKVRMALPGPLHAVRPIKLISQTLNETVWEPITGIDRALSIRNLTVKALTGDIPTELTGPLVDPDAAYKARVENQTVELLLASPERELQLAGLNILLKSPPKPLLIPAIVDMAKAGDFSLSRLALEVLRVWDVPELQAALKFALSIGPYETNRQCAAMILTLKSNPELVRSLTALMVSPDDFTRLWACQALALQTDPDSQAALTLMLGDPNPGVRLAATEALKSRAKLAGSKLIYAAVNDPSELVRAEAYRNLILGGPANLLNEAMRGRTDESWVVRKRVLETLGESKQEGALTLIGLSFSDRNYIVRDVAIRMRGNFTEAISAEELASLEAETHPVVLKAIKELFARKNIQLGTGLKEKLKEFGE